MVGGEGGGPTAGSSVARRNLKQKQNISIPAPDVAAPLTGIEVTAASHQRSALRTPLAGIHYALHADDPRERGRRTALPRVGIDVAPGGRSLALTALPWAASFLRWFLRRAPFCRRPRAGGRPG
jgi:hypothetical protein